MGHKTFILQLASIIAVTTAGILSSHAEELVILQTNDTHSQIDPLEEKDLGGILRRKVVIDSVRQRDKNVLLVDDGDAVQGTLFFNLYKGEVENKLMDDLGYEIRILGNHEFDNGMDELEKMLKDSKSTFISTNYRFTQPGLAQQFKPYTIKTYGDKRVGIIAINLDPKGMIADDNCVGVTYLDPYDAANSMAWYLKNVEGVDYVIAMTHIGYNPENTTLSDVQLAHKSKDIDLILGGHSHTTIDPSNPKSPVSQIVNACGDTVTITQAGKSGLNISRVAINLDNGNINYSLIPIDNRLDDRIDKRLAQEIEPYRAGVDSLMNVKLATSAITLYNYEAPLLNFVADFIRDNGNNLLKQAGIKDHPTVDLAIINKGGLRRSLPKGKISDGMVITCLPFNNRTRVVDIKGRDLIAVLDTMAARGGDGVSSEADITFNPQTKSVISVKINGLELNPETTYRVATIDYLANGGDYLTGFRNSTKVAESKSVLYQDLINYLKKNYKNKKINPSDKVRMRPIDIKK